MRFYVIDKYTLLTALLIIALFIGAVPILSNTVTTSSLVRELPIYSVERSDKKISITFDCAWGNEDVDDIIKILSENNCRATFFVLGTWAEKYPETIKKLHNAGHEIANHSYNHDYYTQLTQDEMISDMEKCDSIIEGLISKRPKLFRPPAGDYNNSVISAVNSSGRMPIQWDVDSIDYKDPTPAQMEERIMGKVQGGSILLFHTGTKNTAAALSGILKRLADEGYEFCPVGELIYYDSYTIDNAGRQIPHGQ